MSDAAYLFKFLRTTCDPEGYYVTRWDKAVPVSVVAATEPAARKAAVALSGTAPRNTRWTLRLQSVEPAAIPEETP